MKRRLLKFCLPQKTAKIFVSFYFVMYRPQQQKTYLLLL